MRECNNTTALIETQHTRALLPPFSPPPPTFVENEIDGRRRTSCVSARIRTTLGGHSAESGLEAGALGRPEQRKTATRSEWESGRERETGKAEMRKRTQSEFQFTPGRAQSNGGREKREGGGKSVQEGRETCYFFLDLSRHTYTEREREKHTTWKR